MPPIDKVAAHPTDIMDDVQFTHLVLGILRCMPAVTALAPDCGPWSRIQLLNKHNPRIMAGVRHRQAEQRQVMRRVRAVLQVIWSYGGHV